MNCVGRTGGGVWGISSYKLKARGAGEGMSKKVPVVVAVVAVTVVAAGESEVIRGVESEEIDITGAPEVLWPEGEEGASDMLCIVLRCRL